MEDELINKTIKDDYQNIHELAKEIKLSLKKIYPNSLFLYFACDDATIDSEHWLVSFGEYGDPKLLDMMGTRIALSQSRPRYFCENVYMNSIVSLDPHMIKYESLKRMRNACIDYAKDINLNIEGYQKSVETRRIVREEPKQKETHVIGQQVSFADLDEHILIVKRELQRLRSLRKLDVAARVIADKIKVSKRQGKFDDVRNLEEELSLIQRIQTRHAIWKKNLEKAWARNKQLKLDRIARLKQQNAQRPQPNFSKMAKQKRQQIAARQAEKKKKKATGGDNVRSC